MTTNVELAEFFSSFAGAVSASDVDRISGTFAKAFGVSDPAAVRFVSGREHIHALISQTVERYGQLGFNRIRIAHLNPNLYDSNHAVADLEWILLDAQGNEIARFDHTYILHRHGGLWRIVFVIVHNEEERLREAGVQT
jgi:hypothetical protein